MQSNGATLVLSGLIVSGLMLVFAPGDSGASARGDPCAAAPETDLKFATVFYPNLTEGSRLRAEANLSLEYEITKDLDWVLAAYDSFESDPATADAGKHDWGVMLSLAWEF